MRLSRLLSSLGVLLAAGPAFAEADTLGVGTGRDGPAIHDTIGPVNGYSGIALDVSVGAKQISVKDSSVFAGGDLVLIWQPTGLAMPVMNADVDITNELVGRWEFARLATVSTGRLTLAQGTVNGYGANHAQVVRVPEYTNLSVVAGKAITASPWNGTSGGIVAFLVSGTLTLEGDILATGAGFRGGQVKQNPYGPEGCVAQIGQTVDGYAQKGEGICSSEFNPNTDWSRGMAAIANGGGGGNCHNAGGGGGGHASAGGKGGASWDGKRDVGGRGGGSLNDGLPSRLVPGGGGGAGEDNNQVGTSGGAGGGVIFIRAAAMAGSGKLLAEGQSASDALHDGGGGGGAGGSIVLRVVEHLSCGRASVRGGEGGDATSSSGSGGGGAGGRLFLQGKTIACTTDVLGGGAGVGDSGYSGASGGPGLHVLVPSGYCYLNGPCPDGICEHAAGVCTPMPDGGVPGPDAAAPDQDAAQPGGDAAQPGEDAAQPGEDAAQPGLDAAEPGVDAALGGPDAEAPFDASLVEEDAGQPSADGSLERDAGPGSDAEARLDAGGDGWGDAAAGDGATVRPSIPSYELGGCGCGTAGFFPLLAFAVVGTARRSRRRRALD